MCPLSLKFPMLGTLRIGASALTVLLAAGVQPCAVLVAASRQTCFNPFAAQPKQQGASNVYPRTCLPW